jgi:O-antigen/teichoic acid export membrane protein
MCVLYYTHNFILFLFCQILSTLVENILVSRQADKMYPFIKEKDIQKLDSVTINQITKNVRAMIAHKLGGVIVNSTDNLIISKFVGLIGVGLYSNYQLIINALNVIISQIFTSITASVGNLGATETEDKRVLVFNVVFFMNFWIFAFISISLFVLVNPFIELWIGKDFVLNTYEVTVIILNFYLAGMRKSALTFREALGIYWYDRHKPVFESIINLVGAILLVKHLGMLGVFLGTTISTLTTCFWVEPYVLYKYGFRRSVIPFFGRYFLYTGLTVLVGLLTVGTTSLFKNVTITNFIIKFVICVVIPNGIFLIIFCKSVEFRYFCDLLDNFIFKKFKRTEDSKSSI